MFDRISPAARRHAALALCLVLTFAAVPAFAQDAEEGEEEAKRKVWSNQADLGFVLTNGNSENVTLSLDNVLTGQWERSAFTLRFGAYEQQSQDITRFAVGTGQDDFVAGEIKETEQDASRLYIFSDYKRQVSDRFYWQVGANWDRDVDAGVLSRLVGYGGLGNVWWDRDDLRFSTDYSLTYTSRDDEIPDPENDGQFIGGRLAWNYFNELFLGTSLTNDMTFFANFDVMKDYRFINTTALTTSMNSRLSIRLSAEFRYSNLPSLEEVDLFDRDPTDPDAILIGTVNARKEKLDSVYRATIVLNF